MPKRCQSEGRGAHAESEGRATTAARRTAAPTPLKLTSVYAAVAAGGRYAAPYTVVRITRDGETVYSARPDRHRVLPEEAARAVATPIRGGSPENLFTAGAGGGTTRRTVWTVAYDDQFTLAVALFADKPGKKKNTTVPAQLPVSPSPTDFTQQTALRLRGRLK